jgi:hypothetical protein
MTKEDELNILQNAVDKLGENSYCGSWLNSILAEVKRDMESDFVPTYTLAAAKAEADSIIAHAKVEAEKERKAAYDKTDALYNSMRAAIYAAERAINQF